MQRYVRTPRDLAISLRDYRKARKLSQTEIGRLFGVQQSTVSEFENYPGSTKLETLFKLMRALGLELIVASADELDRQSSDLEW